MLSRRIISMHKIKQIFKIWKKYPGSEAWHATTLLSSTFTALPKTYLAEIPSQGRVSILDDTQTVLALCAKGRFVDKRRIYIHTALHLLPCLRAAARPELWRRDEMRIARTFG